MKREPSNIAASVHRQLLNVNRTLNEDFNYVLTRFAIERLLYRLVKSGQSDKFVLKGATLFLVWTGRTYRPTKDLDLLGYGDISAKELKVLFGQICNTHVESDGLVFDAQSVKVSEIREDQEYQGKRVELSAKFGKARINLQIDIGFGDSITPEAQEITYPTLIDLPAPHIRAYPRETVIAEKLQAMVDLGITNSRMKDFSDVYVLSKQFDFDGDILAEAIAATFNRRKTPIPSDIPLAFTDAFAADSDKITQWRSFLHRGRFVTNLPEELSEVVQTIKAFLMPPLLAIGANEIFTKHWSNGSWRQ
jgi:predicted nucleotidyltransferase component of viral defense system